MRNALAAAAFWELRQLGRQVDPPVEFAELAEGFPDARAAADTLEAHGRAFDAARVRLWLAESGDTGGLGDSVATFERLGAVPYLAAASEGAKPSR